MFGNIKILLRKAPALLALVMISACVSDTLSQQNLAPEPIAEQNQPSYDPAQREQAIAEIREKSAQPESGELTNAYATADGPNQPLTQQEQAAKILELERSAENNASQVSDQELAAKQESIRQLQNQAKTHYNNAVKQIGN